MDFDTITRVKLGHKCDSVFRTCRINHSEDQEFGTMEAKAKYNVSSKHFKNAFVKLPTALKDMLDDLIKDQPNLASRNHFRQSASFILESPLQCLMKTGRPVTSPESLDKSQ